MESEVKGFSYNISTMGCKANIYDSLVIEKLLDEVGGKRVQNQENADLFILNSCTVTAEADKQALKTIDSVKKKNSSTKTLLTGCLAEIITNQNKIHNADAILANHDRKNLVQKIESILERPLEKNLKNTALDDEVFWGQLPTASLGRTRAFLKVQEGCNDFCTYCIIPYARGKSRSVKLGSVLAEAQRLSDNGIAEIIITGTNIADYGLDLGTSFEDLIELLLTQTDIKRLRVSSLDPTEITPRLLELMKRFSQRFMPHFHVSLQSASSRVLKAMKRKYNAEDVKACLWRIYQCNPQIFVGMDIIAGFPSETLEEHQETISLLKETPWTRLHVFPYSKRENTPALKIKNHNNPNEIKRRAKELQVLSQERYENYVKQFLNQTVHNVLFETPHQSGLEVFLTGHMPNYCRVLIPAPSLEWAQAKAKTIGSVQILNANPKPALDWTLEGVYSS